MRKALITLFFISLLISSCSVYYKFKFKTSRPKNEDTTKQVEYLLKYGVDTSNMFNLRDSSADIFWTTEYPLFSHDTIYVRPIQVRTFDSLGAPEYNWSLCYGNIEMFLSANGRIYHPGLSNNVKNLDLLALAGYTDNPSEFQKIMVSGHDLYVVSFWAMYLGTPVIESMKTLDHFADTSSLDVVHIKCNLGRWLK